METCPAWALDGFQGHTRLSQPGEAGVAELMTGGPSKSGALTGSAHDDVDPFSGQAMSPARSLQGHEDPVGRGTTRSLQPQVLAHRGEKGVRDGHDPLVASFALGDEQ